MLFQPAKSFEKTGIANYRSAYWFALGLYLGGILVGIACDSLVQSILDFKPPAPPNANGIKINIPILGSGSANWISVILSPLFTFVILHVASAVIHAGMLITGAANRIYLRTYKVTAYCYGALSFLFIVITPISAIWLAIAGLPDPTEPIRLGFSFYFWLLIMLSIFVWAIAAEISGLASAHQTGRVRVLFSFLLILFGIVFTDRAACLYSAQRELGRVFG